MQQVENTYPSFSIPAFADFLKFKAAVIIWLAFSAAADVLIAVSLVWYLVSHLPYHTSTVP